MVSIACSGCSYPVTRWFPALSARVDVICTYTKSSNKANFVSRTCDCSLPHSGVGERTGIVNWELMV